MDMTRRVQKALAFGRTYGMSEEDRQSLREEFDRGIAESQAVDVSPLFDKLRESMEEASKVPLDLNNCEFVSKIEFDGSVTQGIQMIEVESPVSAMLVAGFMDRIRQDVFAFTGVPLSHFHRGNREITPEDNDPSIRNLFTNTGPARIALDFSELVSSGYKAPVVPVVKEFSPPIYKRRIASNDPVVKGWLNHVTKDNSK